MFKKHRSLLLHLMFAGHRFTGVSFVIVGAKFLVQDGASSHQHEIQRPSSAWRYNAKLLLYNL